MRAMHAPARRLKPLSIVSPAIFLSHAAALQRLDGIIFTGGIGENSVLIRRLVSERLAVFGLAMDAARNQQPNSVSERLISADGSRVRCAVIPTNEERMIALDAIRLGRIHTAAALA